MDTVVNVKMSVELRDALKKLAEANDRTMALEIRRALKAHVEASK